MAARRPGWREVMEVLLAPDIGRPADLRLPRIADPELRSRLVGYLGRGWIVRSTYRTDGVWVWPQELAERMRLDGVGPSEEMLGHILAYDVLIPARVAAESMAAAGEAIDARVPTAPSWPGRVSYRAGAANAGGAPTDMVRLTPPATAGTAVAGGSWLSPTGWRPDPAPAGVSSRPIASEELSEPAAIDLVDQLSQAWYEELLALGREAPTAGSGLRPARVFDAVDSDGRPAFSPSRLRIVETERRERMIRYLDEGRMVLRAAGRAPDPTTGDPVPRVPLSFRTDGVWVWSDAVAYYLASRGVAPELDFLCHLNERAYLPAAPVGDDVARAASVTAQRAPTPAPRPGATYFVALDGSLLRRRGARGWVELFGADLRWHRCPGGWSLAGLGEINESDATRLVEARWAETVNATVGN